MTWSQSYCIHCQVEHGMDCPLYEHTQAHFISNTNTKKGRGRKGVNWNYINPYWSYIHLPSNTKSKQNRLINEVCKAVQTQSCCWQKAEVTQCVRETRSWNCCIHLVLNSVHTVWLKSNTSRHQNISRYDGNRGCKLCTNRKSSHISSNTNCFTPTPHPTNVHKAETIKIAFS